MCVKVERGRFGCHIGIVLGYYARSELIKLFDELIVKGAGVVTRGPRCLSVGRGRAPRIMLLFSRVYDGDPIVDHDEGDSVLVQPGIRYRIGETIDVVVLHEVSQKGDICAISLHFGESIVQIAHATGDGSEGIGDQIPHGEVEQAAHVFLISANPIYRVVVHLTHDVYPGGLFEIREKLHVLFKTGVKPNAVNAVVRSIVCDPRLPFVYHNGIFGRQIGKRDVLVTRPALRRLGCVLVIGDGAVRMIVTRLVENVVYGEVDGGVVAVPSHVVRNRVDHEILSYISACRSRRTNDRSTYHASVVQGTGQGQQVLWSPEIRVDLVDLLRPEAVVSRPFIGKAGYLRRDGRYPDSGESHVLDIVQFVDDSPPCATAINAEIVARRLTAVGSSIAVGEELVDRLSPPSFLGKGSSQSEIRVNYDEKG